ncbi:MAG TPA: hypothetical protein VIH90_02760 [Candidatus Saccharimonadales bacterium]
MSRPGREQRVVDFEREKVQANLVAYEYLEGKVELDSALVGLKAFGSYGSYLAGEVLLEEATTAQPEVADSLFDKAADSFESAVNMAETEGRIRLIRSMPSSKFRLAQIPILRGIFVEDELPTHEEANDHYSRLLDFGQELARLYRERSRDGTTGNRLMLSHLTGIVAASFLFTRMGLGEFSTEDMFTVQPGLSDTSGGDPRKKSRYSAFDLATFERPDDDSILEVVSRLQVRTNITEGQVVDVTDDITPLIVNRDLKLEIHDDVAARAIIHDCIAESSLPPEETVRLRQRLDLRQNKLTAVTYSDY